jgi:hypothetical protein
VKTIREKSTRFYLYRSLTVTSGYAQLQLFAIPELI